MVMIKAHRQPAQVPALYLSILEDCRHISTVDNICDCQHEEFTTLYASRVALILMLTQPLVTELINSVESDKAH
jgi:hypothetical protein